MDNEDTTTTAPAWLNLGELVSPADQERTLLLVSELAAATVSILPLVKDARQHLARLTLAEDQAYRELCDTIPEANGDHVSDVLGHLTGVAALHEALAELHYESDPDVDVLEARAMTASAEERAAMIEAVREIGNRPPLCRASSPVPSPAGCQLSPGHGRGQVGEATSPTCPEEPERLSDEAKAQILAGSIKVTLPEPVSPTSDKPDHEALPADWPRWASHDLWRPLVRIDLAEAVQQMREAVEHLYPAVEGLHFAMTAYDDEVERDLEECSPELWKVYGVDKANALSLLISDIMASTDSKLAPDEYVIHDDIHPGRKLVDVYAEVMGAEPLPAAPTARARIEAEMGR